MPVADILFIILLIIASVLTIYTNKLTYLAAVAACIVATLIYLGTGLSGIALLGAFFLMGVLATSWKRSTKERFGPVGSDPEKRNAKQVLANGGMAAVLGLLAWILPEHQAILLLMIACCFSSATADTVSSELGMVYGTKYYNVLNFKEDAKGENGVISFEGTLLGIAGSLVIVLLFASVTQQWQLSPILIIILAGTVGNLADSVLGATLERNNIIGNNAVNFLNTFIAALIGGLLA